MEINSEIQASDILIIIDQLDLQASVLEYGISAAKMIEHEGSWDILSIRFHANGKATVGMRIYF